MATAAKSKSQSADEKPGIFRVLLSPKAPHILQAATVYGSQGQKQYEKLRDDYEREHGVRCTEVILNREGEFVLIPPEKNAVVPQLPNSQSNRGD